MILIKKGKEPNSWTAHRTTPGADYEATDDLREALLKDQGYICAYCMRRIPVKDAGTKDTSRIEHIKPQNLLQTPAERMNYGNLVICCPGAMVSTEKDLIHCDRHKDKTSISLSPLQAKCIATISYLADGTIKSSDAIYDKEINDVLNLNLYLLKQNRMSIKTEVIAQLNAKQWRPAELRRVLAKYKNYDEDGCFKEYCGVAIFYLERKLRSLEK